MRRLEGLTPFDMEYQERLFVGRLEDLGMGDSRRARAIIGRMRGHLDDTAYDLERGLIDWRYTATPANIAEWMLNSARRAEAVSPFMPEVVAVRARLDWDSVAPRLAEVGRKFAHQPAVSREIGRHYLRASSTATPSPGCAATSSAAAMPRPTRCSPGASSPAATRRDG